jgi:hypothetical protein
VAERPAEALRGDNLARFRTGPRGAEPVQAVPNGSKQTSGQPSRNL